MTSYYLNLQTEGYTSIPCGINLELCDEPTPEGVFDLIDEFLEFSAKYGGIIATLQLLAVDTEGPAIPEEDAPVYVLSIFPEEGVVFGVPTTDGEREYRTIDEWNRTGFTNLETPTTQ